MFHYNIRLAGKLGFGAPSFYGRQAEGFADVYLKAGAAQNPAKPAYLFGAADAYRHDGNAAAGGYESRPVKGEFYLAALAAHSLRVDKQCLSVFKKLLRLG